METCNFCKKTFFNKYNLKVHIDSARACLKIQNRTIDNKFTCSSCNKTYTRNNDLKKHKCKSVTINKITNNNITNNNTTNNNTTNNNTTNNNTTNNITNITNNNTTKIEIIQNMVPLDLSEDKIRDIVQREFTKEYIRKDHQGVADFIIDKILKLDETGNYNYISVDTNRHVGVYKDIETGNIIKDVCYMKLAKPVYSQAFKKAKDFANEEYKNDEKDIFINREIVNAIQLISKYDEPHPRFKKYISNRTALKLTHKYFKL